jgi:hypothetical protein
VLERKDLMAVLPTGFGKSMCFLHPFWTSKIIHGFCHFYWNYIYKNYIILFINKMSLEINKEFLTGLYIFRDIWVQSRKFGLKILSIFFSGHHIGFKINFNLN